MKLEEVTAEIRPRTQWESVDLGVALTRRHFKALAQIWLLTVLPIWALCIALLLDHPFWCLCLIVFLRPVYERPILFFLSRALFNAPPKVWAVVRGYPKIIAPGLIRSLTVARFSPVRSLLLPLFVLEGARGHQYRDRRSAILRSGGGTGGYLTFVCIALEIVLVMGFVFLLVALIPAHLAPDWGEMYLRFFSFDGIAEGLPPQLAWFAIGIFLVAMSFVELFYVGCGFALYLNSRSHVEGWDIEITFRRLAEKLTRGGAAALLVGLTVLLGLSPLALAQNSPESTDPIRAQIREIMGRDEFEIHKGQRKMETDPDSNMDWRGGDFSFFAMLGEVLYWIVIVAAVIALGYVIYLNRHLFTRRGVRAPAGEPPPARTRTVMGMDVTSDTLPEDIPAAALVAWQDGDAQLATSLLYRGAICWLVERAQLPLIDSDTEDDCVRHSSGLDDQPRHDYFTRLTAQWIQTAYGERPPSDLIMRQFCETWPFDLRRTEA